MIGALTRASSSCCLMKARYALSIVLRKEPWDLERRGHVTGRASCAVSTASSSLPTMSQNACSPGFQRPQGAAFLVL